VLGFSLPVSVRTWDAADIGLDPRRNVGEMGLVASDLLGLSRGGCPMLKGRNKAWGGSTFLVGEDTGDDVVLLSGGSALGRLA
jgi:hypothetical protein